MSRNLSFNLKALFFKKKEKKVTVYLVRERERYMVGSGGGDRQRCCRNDGTSRST